MTLIARKPAYSRAITPADKGRNIITSKLTYYVRETEIKFIFKRFDIREGGT